jgi:diaminopimelate decarboxylase
MSHSPELLHRLADTVGTPFWLYDAARLRQRIADIKFIAGTPGVQARFAMKACPVTRVLKEMAAAGIWIDAVSGNEVLRALRAGHAAGNDPPVICFTADVFRDNALDVIMEHNVLPNVGSPGMVDALRHAGYRGPVSMRINPGFGHGHVNACDTGGPSSKHGIWLEDAERVRDAAERTGLRVVMLHSHIGSGPQIDELVANLSRLADEFSRIAPNFHHLQAVNLGGGIPHDYRNPDAVVPLDRLRALFAEARQRLCWSIGRDLRLEIEPGRYYVAPAATLVTTVTDVKHTVTNEKGAGETFAMVDAGFVDLVRPAMYGSYHRIEVVGRMHEEYREPIVVAGPLCESGDVFTRDETELLQPRPLPRPRIGELLTLHDAGAYGYAMSSNYNSIGRAPQLWLEEDGTVEMISRRESLEDLLKAETSERLD